LTVFLSLVDCPFILGNVGLGDLVDRPNPQTMCISPKKAGFSPFFSLLFAFLYFSPALSAQNGEVFSDRDTSHKTHQLFNILMAHREVEYFNTPVYFNSSRFGMTHDSVPTGHTAPFLEANLAPYYVMFKGRDLQHPVLQRFSLAFEPQMTFRIYLAKSQSYPVRPPNFHPKFHLNYFIQKRIDTILTRFSHLTLTIAHLSNGQPNPFFLDSINQVVNLRNGNFSTNYLRLSYTFSRYLNPKTSINDPDGWKRNLFWSATVGYQREMSFGKLLAFEEGQDLTGYGRNRIVSRLQLRSGNFLGAKALFSRYSQPPVYQASRIPIVERDSTVMENGIPVKLLFITPYVVLRKVPEVRNKHPRGYWNWMARLDHTLVLDRNAVNRHALDFIFELRNLNWRSFSVVAKGSWGRDYINLRFQDNIQSYQLGISYNMDRYKVPFTRYLNAFEKGEVVDRDFVKAYDLNPHRRNLPSIDAYAETDTARTIYTSELKPYNGRYKVDLREGSFDRPPAFRWENGRWVMVSNKPEQLRHIKRKGWYNAASFHFIPSASPDQE
jgi:hypothetical protein